MEHLICVVGETFTIYINIRNEEKLALPVLRIVMYVQQATADQRVVE